MPRKVPRATVSVVGKHPAYAGKHAAREHENLVSDHGAVIGRVTHVHRAVLAGLAKAAPLAHPAVYLVSQQVGLFEADLCEVDLAVQSDPCREQRIWQRPEHD